MQIYTALIYEGPGVTRRIAEELANLLRRDGFANVREAVGVDADIPKTSATFILQRTLS